MKKDCIIFRETLRQKISRSLSACALIVAFVVLFFPLVSCAAKTPYEVLQDSVVSEMNAYRYADHSVIDKFIEYMDIAELEQFDIDPGEFSRSFFSEFDYTIDSLEVDEDSAYVKLTLISKDYPRFEEMLALGVDDMEETYAKRNISSEDYKEKYGQLVMECIDGVDVISRKSIEINYVKDGNTWRPDSEIFYLVMGALVLPEGE